MMSLNIARVNGAWHIDLAGCLHITGELVRYTLLVSFFGNHGNVCSIELSSASNIIFSNGNLDPWSVGGVGLIKSY